jgi:hypothetical protein
MSRILQGRPARRDLVEPRAGLVDQYRAPATTLSLHGARLCRGSVNFAHVPVVYASHLAIVPGDRDCIPTRFGDDAAVSGITAPANPGAHLEAL